ncbi:hypothetical protein HUG12_09065 [Halorarum salinum]|uniref:Uncharacterized protein n=1 Tax=Halorarum salinum TaxID=2743089 RepID=A0A7D5LAF4_9EURY|nr:hypothetical protein HUG12_09065 [Halobaculum salinum]
MVALVGATALAGCSRSGTPNRQAITLGDDGQQNDVGEDDVQGIRQGETVRAFVGSYHGDTSCWTRTARNSTG